MGICAFCEKNKIIICKYQVCIECYKYAKEWIETNCKKQYCNKCDPIMIGFRRIINDKTR